MRFLRLLLSVVSLSALLGCQQAMHQKEGPLLYEAVKNGDKVVLNKAISIPLQRARTYLQGGREISAQQVDRFEPSCEFEVRTLRDTRVEIAPDTFAVNRVRNYEEGSEGFFSSFQLGVRSSATIKYQTTLRMSSERQPDVLQLICSWEETASRGHYLRVEQFKNAVGAYISLQK